MSRSEPDSGSDHRLSESRPSLSRMTRVGPSQRPGPGPDPGDPQPVPTRMILERVPERRLGRRDGSGCNGWIHSFFKSP
jgi:hypothetical protein